MYLQLHDNYDLPGTNYGVSYPGYRAMPRQPLYQVENALNQRGVTLTRYRNSFPQLGAACSVTNGDVRKAFVLSSKVDWTNTAKNAKGIWSEWGKILKKKDEKATGVAISVAVLAKVGALLIKSVDFIVKTIDNAEAQRTEELAAQVYDRNEFDLKNLCRQTNTQLMQNANKAFASINEWAQRYEQDDLKKRDRRAASRQILVRTRALDLFMKEIDARGIQFTPGTVEPAAAGGADLKKLLPVALAALAFLR
jgi:hypothetical protein